MYGVYNSETLERLINTVHQMHNATIPNEELFAGKLSTAFTWYVNRNGVNHYAINSLLSLKTLKEKYVKLYEEFIMQLCSYDKATRNLAKGYLTISLITPSKLQEILNTVQVAIQKTNPDYDIFIKRLHLCYEIKLVTFVLCKAVLSFCAILYLISLNICLRVLCIISLYGALTLHNSAHLKVLFSSHCRIIGDIAHLKL